MKLFKRHPMVPWRPKVDEQIIPTDIQANNPAFAKDFAFLNTELVKYFQVLDNEALQGQNQFRLDQIILIVGSALATVLGAIQAAFLSSAWFGGGETVLTIILAGVALRSRALKAQERYFTNRLKAETLRAEYFLYLGRIGIYADDRYRDERLIRRVADVRAGESRE